MSAIATGKASTQSLPRREPSPTASHVVVDLDVVQTEEKLISRCAELRAWAHRAGHPLAQKVHEADRWVASTALVLGSELVAGDGFFEGVPEISLVRVGPT